MRVQRGVTLAETLVAIVIFSLMLAAIGALAGPLMNGPAAGSSKTDTVGAAAFGLDTIERDVRQSDVNGVFVCATGVTVTCSQPTSLTASPYTAVLTAYDSSGVFNPGAPPGGPNWKGYVVYSQPAGSSLIYRTYEAWLVPPASYQAGAVAAVTAASTLPTGTTVAVPNTQSLSIGLSTSNGEISLQLVSSAGSGRAANSTTYATTILARN